MANMAKAATSPGQAKAPSKGTVASDRQNQLIDKAMRELAGGLARYRNVFTALGDENRQRILFTLLNHFGGMRAGEIADAVGLSRPAVSHHLKTLRESGLVSSYASGTKNFYHVCSSADVRAGIAEVTAQASRLAAFANEQSDPSMRQIRKGE